MFDYRFRRPYQKVKYYANGLFKVSQILPQLALENYFFQISLTSQLHESSQKIETTILPSALIWHTEKHCACSGS